MAASSSADQDAADLSRLLKALGAGARAVQSLPVSQLKDGSDYEDNDDDAFAFESSFPEFAAALAQARESERAVLANILQEISSHTSALDYEEYQTFSAELFELSALACDLLLEQVEAYLQHGSGSETKTSLQNWSKQARKQSRDSWSTMLRNHVDDLEKPQVTYKMAPPCNGRQQVFVPAVHPDKPHGITKAPLKRIEGHGHDTCLGQLRPLKQFPPNVVAPSYHMSHYYQEEIQGFSPTAWELEPMAGPPTIVPAMGKLTATWIDTPQALHQLGHRLEHSNSIQMICMDLEAHSYRSFAGMVCLVQLTVPSWKNESFLIDTLKIPAKDINRAMQPVLANPAIVKILHGADSDITWLQSNFGLYIVHLWDIGRAARALDLASASYAHLLQRYCRPHEGKTNTITSLINEKQTFQLSDWRQRPLPPTMQQYAIADTHFLGFIALHLKWELQRKRGKDFMKEVLELSRQVSLIRYPGPPLFDPDGYSKLLLSKNRGRGSQKQQQKQCTPLQEFVLKALWDWRDATARQDDESQAYVCPNLALVRISMSMPTTPPLPGNLKLPNGEYEGPLLKVIAKAIADFDASGGSMTKQEKRNQQQQQHPAQEDEYGEEDELNEATIDRDDKDIDKDDIDNGQETTSGKQRPVQSSKSSAFFKPGASQDRQRRGMMSPVMGTEALYKQAGWMTPQGKGAPFNAQQRGSQVISGEKLFEEEEEDDDEEVEVEEIHTTTASETEQHSSPKKGASVDTFVPTPAVGALALKSVPSGKVGSPQAGVTRTGRGARVRNADGFASARAVREASKSPSAQKSLEDDAAAARNSSAQLRNDLMINHNLNVLGLLSATATAGDGSNFGANEEQVARGNAAEIGKRDAAAVEEEFSIPRSMREIYKISNRNRRLKKAGSPTPERGATPTSEKERVELQKAEALLRDRGMDAAGFLFTNDGAEDGNNTSSKKSKSSDHESSLKAGGSQSKQEDLAIFRKIGWVAGAENDSSVLSECYGQPGAAAAAGMDTKQGSTVPGADPHTAMQQGAGYASTTPRQQSYDYSQMGTVPLQSAAHMFNNPFFSGAALQGGPLSQSYRNDTGNSKPSRGKGGGNSGRGGSGGNKSRGRGGGSNNNAERPEKRDGGRSHVYRSNR